jgi:hypothetical protein
MMNAVFTLPSHIREFAWIVGAEVPDTPWLLSDYDVWVENPHYTGPKARHPEDYDYEEGDQFSAQEVTVSFSAYDESNEEEIPF